LAFGYSKLFLVIFGATLPFWSIRMGMEKLNVLGKAANEKILRK
jgi:hypothetical protein